MWLVLGAGGRWLGEERRDVVAEADHAVIGLGAVLATGVVSALVSATLVWPALVWSSVIRAPFAATALGLIAR